MKKVFLISASLLCSIFVLVSFSTKKKAIPYAGKSAASIINCSPATPPLITATAFVARYEPGGIRVRKNVDALTQVEINALKVGILKMRALPYTNPTSWLYQAAIHGTLLTDNLPSWNFCHRAGEEFFFLAWHRMYLYFFERILRAKSGRADLTVPYWNYQIDPVLHPAFRDNSVTNPLYTYRNPSINNGGALPSSIATAFANALNLIPYYSFQSSLTGPHGSVHTTVNGDMTSVSTAAKDPVFWLHHSNIDRLWEEWLSKCNGRSNPVVDSAWLNQSYTFFDELGNPVSMLGSQVLKASTQLNYRYDVISPDITCSGARPTLVSKQLLLKKEFAVEIKGRSKKADFVQESRSNLESFIKTNKRTSFRFASATAPERLVATFDGIKIDQMPEGVVEVYLNLPAGVLPVATSKYFVGLLDLFSAQHQSGHPLSAMERKDEIELDITKAAQALRLTLTSLKNAELSFVVRGGIVGGKEVKTEAQITIPHIQFSIVEFRN